MHEEGGGGGGGGLAKLQEVGVSLLLWLFLVLEPFNGMRFFGAVSSRAVQSQNFKTERWNFGDCFLTVQD